MDERDCKVFTAICDETNNFVNDISYYNLIKSIKKSINIGGKEADDIIKEYISKNWITLNYKISEKGNKEFFDSANGRDLPIHNRKS